MSTLTLSIKRPARPLQRRAKRQHKATKYVFGLGFGKITPVHTGIPDLSEREAFDDKPSKRVIAETWAKLTGIVNTGETDLSTREGFGY